MKGQLHAGAQQSRRHSSAERPETESCDSRCFPCRVCRVRKSRCCGSFQTCVLRLCMVDFRLVAACVAACSWRGNDQRFTTPAPPPHTERCLHPICHAASAPAHAQGGRLWFDGVRVLFLGSRSGARAGSSPKSQTPNAASENAFIPRTTIQTRYVFQVWSVAFLLPLPSSSNPVLK